MIEIKLTTSKDSFCLRITGHAGYAEHGKDIVCSAVSILFQTLASNVCSLCNKEDECRGECEERIVELTEGDSWVMGNGQEAVNALKVILPGFRMLADNYQQYVCLKGDLFF